MPKHLPQIIARETSIPWMLRVEAPYSKEINALFRGVPGVTWDPGSKTRRVPREVFDYIEEELAALGCEIVAPDRPIGPPPKYLDGCPLKDFQRDGVRDRLIEGGILAFETGLGKTPSALAWFDQFKDQALVICPPSVMEQWRDECRKWLSFEPTIINAKTLKKPEKWPSTRMGIISWQALHLLPLEFQWPDYLILDECHAAKNPKTRRSKQAREIRERARLCLGLSATPIACEPYDLANVLDLIFPGRFPYWQTVRRYSIMEQEEIVDRSGEPRLITKYSGLQPAHEAEFRFRLEQVCSFATREEHASELPPLTPIILRIERGERKETRAKKIWNDGDGKPTIFLFHHKARAYALDKDAITGDIANHAKRKGIAEQKVAEGQPIVATYDSILEGVNWLGNVEQAVFLEIPTTPKEITQAMGRFSRLSSTHAGCSVFLLISKGTEDEDRLGSLLGRLDAVNRALEKGEGSGQKDLRIAARDDGLKRLDRLIEDLEIREPVWEV